MSERGERLREAYEATAYRVDEGPLGPFVIRVGARSAAADALVAAAGADAWAFITACNPGSVPLAAADNAARMARLATRVRARGLPHYAGAGAAADAGWPAEPSLFIVGLGVDEAVPLARDFDQLAIVAGRRGEAARLVWVDGAAAT
ncbi:MAG: DUF3293 domain-containing protein [Planctomycetaceae bacterium]